MSWLSDIAGGGAQKAAGAQETGLLAGMLAARGYLDQNPGIITQYGGQALQPYQSNYNAVSPGLAGSSTSLGNLLGLNGASGNQSALSALEATPGYQFTLQQGDNAINAAAAANGTLNSGNQLTALSNYNQGLAQSTYQNAVNNALSSLSTYGGQANAAAGGIAGVNMNEASGLTGNNNILAQLLQSTYTGIGNAQANAELRQGAGDASLLGGALSLGSSLLGGLGGLGGIGSALGGMLGPASGAIF